MHLAPLTVAVAYLLADDAWGWVSRNADAITALATVAAAAGAIVLGVATLRVSMHLRAIERQRIKWEENDENRKANDERRKAEAHRRSMPMLAFSAEAPEPPLSRNCDCWQIGVHNEGGAEAGRVTVTAKLGDKTCPSRTRGVPVKTGGSAVYFEIDLPDEMIVRVGAHHARPADGVEFVAQSQSDPTVVAYLPPRDA